MKNILNLPLIECLRISANGGDWRSWGIKKQKMKMSTQVDLSTNDCR
jgi:hypothetical protein